MVWRFAGERGRRHRPTTQRLSEGHIGSILPFGQPRHASRGHHRLPGLCTANRSKRTVRSASWQAPKYRACSEVCSRNYQESPVHERTDYSSLFCCCLSLSSSLQLVAAITSHSDNAFRSVIVIWFTLLVAKVILALLIHQQYLARGPYVIDFAVYKPVIERNMQGTAMRMSVLHPGNGACARLYSTQQQTQPNHLRHSPGVAGTVGNAQATPHQRVRIIHLQSHAIMKLI